MNRKFWPGEGCEQDSWYFVWTQSIVDAKRPRRGGSSETGAGWRPFGRPSHSRPHAFTREILTKVIPVHAVRNQCGKYHALNLFPGNYEVGVQKKGFAGDIKNVVVKAGTNLTLDFSLLVADPNPNEVPSVSYDSLYPQGRGRDLAEKTCIICHGAGFLPRHQWDESQWNSAIDLMSNPGCSTNSYSSTLSPQDRRDLAAYLARNFGPDSPKRMLDVGAEMPLDEQVLSKAMYVEYYLPPRPDKGDRLLHDPHFDPEGNVWYTDRGGDRIGKLDPRTGVFTDYLIPDPKAFPHGLTVDSGGFPWFVGNFDLGRVEILRLGKWTSTV